MFSFLKKKPKERACKNCVNFKKGDKPTCLATNNGTLRAFPFINTKCKSYKQK